MRGLTGIGAVGKKGEAQQNDNVQKHGIFFSGDYCLKMSSLYRVPIVSQEIMTTKYEMSKLE